MYDEHGSGSFGSSDRRIPDLFGMSSEPAPSKSKICSEEQLQTLYECTLVSSTEERRTAIIKWSTGAGVAGACQRVVRVRELRLTRLTTSDRYSILETRIC